MMMDATSLRHALCSQLVVNEIEDGLRVSTQCLYPSNSSVTLTVRGRGDQYLISDEGGALEELSSSGSRPSLSDRQIRLLTKTQGLRVKDGAIFSPIVLPSEVPAAILLVANASQAVAEWGYAHVRFSVTRNFKRDLEIVLARHFNEALKHNTHIVGESTKAHRFDNVIYLDNDRKLLVDPVMNDPSSINSRVVANMDIRLLKDPTIKQLMVYDDSLAWSSADLRLLRVGTPNVSPFSLSEQEIQRLAA